ncbi:hypothetical protein R3P38DRAFT_2955152 [Favolaschia claudopus]|uniref:Mitochondrial carrier protein n=1 Tax=Favolaschia claudopus TaxID=2862362 RepID=A0AAW0BEA5_9AGAR
MLGIESQGSIQAAVARTAARSLALYFSRPVRLFRPSKVSGWHSLRGLAAQDGASLTPAYLSSLVKNQGFAVIGKHFFPPMVVNALLGTVLWASYAEASNVLHPHIGSHPTAMAAIAGSVAGGTQALVSAPAENVRLLVEGGTSHNSWLHAWKEVFRGTPSPSTSSRHDAIEEIRQVRSWMKEVGGMAGRGWEGLGYTLGKDVTGMYSCCRSFAAFFAIFEVTRRVAHAARDATRAANSTSSNTSKQTRLPQLPQLVYGATLVSGGVIAGMAYEVIGRPWDAARHAARLNLLTDQDYRPPLALVLQQVKQEGFLSLFRGHTASHAVTPSTVRSRIYSVLRTLARVGPWGVGFLVYQVYDPRLS